MSPPPNKPEPPKQPEPEIPRKPTPVEEPPVRGRRIGAGLFSGEAARGGDPPPEL